MSLHWQDQGRIVMVQMDATCR